MRAPDSIPRLQARFPRGRDGNGQQRVSFFSVQDLKQSGFDLLRDGAALMACLPDFRAQFAHACGFFQLNESEVRGIQLEVDGIQKTAGATDAERGVVIQMLVELRGPLLLVDGRELFARAVVRLEAGSTRQAEPLNHEFGAQLKQIGCGRIVDMSGGHGGENVGGFDEIDLVH